MDIDKMNDLFNELKIARSKFADTTSPYISIIDEPFELFTRILALPGWLEKDDDEVIFLEIIAAAARRMIASIVLIESGMFQESHMILRNAIENVLIFMDITCNYESLNEWKNSKHNDPELFDNDSWYFKPSKIMKRIEKDEAESIYPLSDKQFARICYEQWKLISNKTLHAHSYSQIIPLVAEEGGFKILENKTEDGYKEDFHVFRKLFLNLIGLMLRVNKFRTYIEQNYNSNDLVRSIADRYNGLSDMVNIINVSGLREFIEKYGLTFDVSSLPGNAEISYVYFDYSNPGNMALKLKYSVPVRND